MKREHINLKIILKYQIKSNIIKSFVVSQCSQHLSATMIVQQTQSYLSIKDLKVYMKQALLTKVKHVVQIKAVLVVRIKVKQVVWIKVKPVTQIK